MSFSQLRTLSEAYKVMQLQGKKFSALKGFYLATLGGAEALSLEDKVGNFGVDKESDFVVWRWSATDLQKLRISRSMTLEEKLFAVRILGDDRNVEATYVAGKRVYLNSQ